MSEEEDFSGLPIEARWRNPKWKARQSAYESLANEIQKGEQSFNPSPEDLKLCASDTNVIALESAIKVLKAILETPKTVGSVAVSIRKAVAQPLAEKGLIAAKPAVKQAATEVLLTLVEVADPAGVVDDILAMLSSSKSPKAIAAGVQTLESIFKEFGSPVTDPRPVLKVLPTFFFHTDRNVRQAATALACAITRWVGEPTTMQVLNGLKPIQLSELQAAIAKVDFSQFPSRMTRQQSIQHNSRTDEASATTSRAQNGGATIAGGSTKAFEVDPWDLLDSVDVVTKIPSDFWELVGSAKWKERHDALSSLIPAFEKAPRMNAKGDYSAITNDLLRVVQRDTNQMCATDAIQLLTFLALGLRQKFDQYAPRTLEAVVERFKEKKQSVIEIVTKAIDAVFFHVLKNQFSLILESVVNIGMKHKTPQVRIESAKYCCHLLCETPVVPKVSEIEEITAVALKLLAETAEPMRAAAASVIAAVIKLIGQNKIASHLKALDEHKMKRINETVEKTNVVAKAPQSMQSADVAPRANPKSAAVPQRQVNLQNTGSAIAKKASGPSSIMSSYKAPIIRTATSQAASSVPPMRMAVETTSPPSRRAPALTMADDVSMGLTSPLPSNPLQRAGRPSLSSTPKIVKRTSTSAEFTPARGLDTFRRRIISPAKCQMGPASQNQLETDILEQELDVGEIARLSAELELEKSLRVDAEKRLARIQVERDRELLRLQEEVSVLKLQLKAQKEEFEVWIKNKERRWSQASLGSDDVGNKLSVLSLEADPNQSARQAPSSRPSSRRPPSRVLPISPKLDSSHMPSVISAPRTGNDDWERAVSMTHSLRQRVELLKQQKQRNLMP